MPTSSTIFQIPGELRNEVYKHVFSSSSPLLLVMGNAGVPIITSQDCNESPHEYNQLKYVNKQLYLETSGIEALFNDIKVARVEEADETPGLFFLDWVGLLTHKQLGWLDGCTIILADVYYSQPENQDTGVKYGYMTESVETIAALAKFCNAQPGVKVDYHLPCLNLSQDLFDHHIFFDVMGAAHSQVHGLVADNIDDHVWPFNDMDIDYWAWDVPFWRHFFEDCYVDVKELRARNLRFKPCDVQNKELLELRLGVIFGEGSTQYATILR